MARVCGAGGGRGPGHAGRDAAGRSPGELDALMSAPSVRPAATIAAGGLALERWRRDDLDALLAAVASTLDHLRPWMSWPHDTTATRRHSSSLPARSAGGAASGS